jgi:hypothetical protein
MKQEAAAFTRAVFHDTDWAMVWWFRNGRVVKFQIHDDSATEAAALRGR